MSLLKLLKERPEDLLVPNEAIWKDASAGLKQALDVLAKKYTTLGGLHVEGLKAEQVWIQARMVLEGVAEGLRTELESMKEGVEEGDFESELESGSEILEDSDSELQSESESETALAGGSTGFGFDQDVSDSDLAAEDGKIHESDRSLDQSESAEKGEDECEDEDGEGLDRGSLKGESDPQFDLSEFQQHVLQLEQEPEDDSESIDYGADLQGSSDEGADLHYNDFFALPSKKTRPGGQTKKVKFVNNDEYLMSDSEVEAGVSNHSDEESHLESVMSSTRKDLFDSGSEDEDAGSAEPGKKLSRFEQQQYDLACQIEELENENVGEKEWGMRGEIKASQRPQDSLIDADLEFERGSKPAPVNTEESTTTLEELIKERIRKQNFDDLPRRSEVAEERAKRELPELQETQSQKSLAELYEEEHMRNENPEYYSKQDSAAAEAAHAEITNLFTSVSRKLDALCSWHFTPKAAAPSLSVVTDQPSISMEEAQPGTLAAESQLAPQEVYRSDAVTPMANTEMTASLKRKKRRDKARSRAVSAAAKTKASSRDKDSMFSALQKGNVTLVDRRGQKRDMRGNTVQEKAPPKAANIKL